MNDRYLYRAKRKNWRELPREKWWVTGYLVNKKCGEYNTVGFEEFKTMIIVTSFSDGGIEWCYIDEDTLCQCTGLKDKNGKLIWENDILMCHGNKKDLCKVCFGEFKVIDIEDMVAVDIVQGWYYKPLETDTLSKCEPFCYEMPLTNYYLERMEAEVVGNIFDNPELLEVGE